MTVRTIRAPTGRGDIEIVEGITYRCFDGTNWVRVVAEIVDNSEGTGGTSIDALSDLPQDGAEDGNGIVWNGTNGEWEATPVVQFISDIPQDGATQGQVIKWNGSEWAPGTDETGGGGISSLSDLPVDGAVENQVIKLNSEGQWAPGNDDGGGVSLQSISNLWFTGTAGAQNPINVGDVSTTIQSFNNQGTTLYFIRGVGISGNAFVTGSGIWSESENPTTTNSWNAFG